MTRPDVFDSQITWLYYEDMPAACAFFEEVMGFKLLVDQGWAKIYHVSRDAFLGAVAGDRGFRKPQKDAPVLVTLVTQDVEGWYNYLEKKGAKILREIQDMEEIQIRCFFFEGPGGYAFEVQEFLAPDAVQIFHGGMQDPDASS